MAKESLRVTRLPCGRARPPARMYPGVPANRGRATLAVSAFLVEMPGRRPLLVDTGWGRAITGGDRIGERRLPETLRAFWRPEAAPEESAAEQLAARGYRPEDLEGILLTTLEPDHVGGLEELAGAPRVWLPEPERFWNCRTAYAVRQPRRLWEDRPVEVFYFRGRPDGPVARAWDLFGDGQVLCVSTPGYTEGLCAVEIRGPSDRVAVIQSDLAVTPECLEREQVPLGGFNRDYQRRSLRWLAARGREEKVTVLFGHDSAAGPDTWEL